jgi:hypothetical protein
MKVDLPSAHYSTLSRRARLLSFQLSAHAPRQIRHLVIDSTGLKVYGEGEWKVRTHGTDKRRTWRKLHIAMDARTQQITAAVVTDKEQLDRTTVPSLLRQTGAEIKAVCADGAYDFEQCYRAIKEHGAVPLIPPRSDAVERGKSPFESRDENVREIKQLGRKQWKISSGYHRRSLVECAFFRLKTVLSERLCSRRADTQMAEAHIRCLALNRMTELGMPHGSAI